MILSISTNTWPHTQTQTHNGQWWSGTVLILQMWKLTPRESSDVSRSQLTDGKPGSTLRQTGFRPWPSLAVSSHEPSPKCHRTMMRQRLPQRCLGIQTQKLCDLALNINNWATCFSRVPGSAQSHNSAFANSGRAVDVTVILYWVHQPLLHPTVQMCKTGPLNKSKDQQYPPSLPSLNYTLTDFI